MNTHTSPMCIRCLFPSTKHIHHPLYATIRYPVSCICYPVSAIHYRYPVSVFATRYPLSVSTNRYPVLYWRVVSTMPTIWLFPTGLRVLFYFILQSTAIQKANNSATAGVECTKSLLHSSFRSSNEMCCILQRMPSHRNYIQNNFNVIDKLVV